MLHCRRDTDGQERRACVRAAGWACVKRAAFVLPALSSACTYITGGVHLPVQSCANPLHSTTDVA